jgi:hypothetical protein
MARTRALPRTPTAARSSVTPEPPAPPTRGVTVVLDLPDASVTDVLELADTLLSLARDLAPDADARTEVHLAGPTPTGARRDATG